MDAELLTLPPDGYIEQAYLFDFFTVGKDAFEREIISECQA